MNKIFLFLAALILSYAGFRMGEKTVEQEKISLDVHPEREYPLTEPRSFTFVVYASNHAAWCERSLGSIFAQDYGAYRVIFIDDASIDHTYEKVQQFVIEAAQDEKVILMRNERQLGLCASLYRAMEHCSDREVIIPLQAKDWLCQDKALLRLNGAFQNPDVWIARSRAMSYPEFQLQESKGLFAFYAALLKTLPVTSLFSAGQIAMTESAYECPLLELSGGRVRTYTDPFLLINQAEFSPSQKQNWNFLMRTECRPLAQFPSAQIDSNPVDLLVFSYDRPLQLHALLESIKEYVSGIQDLFVIYRASDERYDRAYKELAMLFPSIRWLSQSENPHKDFKPLVLQALAGGTAPYVLFAVDDLVVKDFVDLTQCTSWMEKTGAYGFYLRLGSHIRHCYMVDQPQPVPPHIPLGHEVFAWDFRAAKHDWAFAGTLDMTIYRKADIQPLFAKLKYKHPNRLEQAWAEHRMIEGAGLCFADSKVVNLPLNIVNPSDCPHSHFMTVEELLSKWNEGMKMDISPLFQIENPSPHINYAPQFVKR